MTPESLKGIRAVLFDLDETLIDAPRGLEAAHKAVAERICEYLSCEESNVTRVDIKKNLDEFSEKMNLRREYDRDSWWPKLLDEAGIRGELSQDQKEKISEIYWNTYADNAVPYTDTETVLEYLDERGYKLGLVTDTDESVVSKRERISRHEFSDLFDTVVIGGEDTSEPKPDSESFKLAARELGVDPNECVMVGDKPFTDIKGANSVGMKSIQVERRDWNSNENPDFTISCLSDLRELL